ncbi:class I SAM-dependent methyltransferase, partial [Candidatus Omnitrophota bacterium]
EIGGVQDGTEVSPSKKESSSPVEHRLPSVGTATRARIDKIIQGLQQSDSVDRQDINDLLRQYFDLANEIGLAPLYRIMASLRKDQMDVVWDEIINLANGRRLTNARDGSSNMLFWLAISPAFVTEGKPFTVMEQSMKEALLRGIERLRGNQRLHMAAQALLILNPVDLIEMVSIKLVDSGFTPNVKVDHLREVDYLVATVHLDGLTLASQSLLKIWLAQRLSQGVSGVELTMHLKPLVRLFSEMDRVLMDLPAVGCTLARPLALHANDLFRALYDTGIVKALVHCPSRRPVLISRVSRMPIAKVSFSVPPGNFVVSQLLRRFYQDLGLMTKQGARFQEDVDTFNGILKTEILTIIVASYFLDVPQATQHLLHENNEPVLVPEVKMIPGGAIDPWTGLKLPADPNMIVRDGAWRVYEEDGVIGTAQIDRHRVQFFRRLALLGAAAQRYEAQGEDVLARLYKAFRASLRIIYERELELTSEQASQLLGEQQRGTMNTSLFSAIRVLGEALRQQGEPARQQLEVLVADGVDRIEALAVPDAALRQAMHLAYEGRLDEAADFYAGKAASSPVQADTQGSRRKPPTRRSGMTACERLISTIDYTEYFKTIDAKQRLLEKVIEESTEELKEMLKAKINKKKARKRINALTPAGFVILTIWLYKTPSNHTFETNQLLNIHTSRRVKEVGRSEKVTETTELGRLRELEKALKGSRVLKEREVSNAFARLYAAYFYLEYTVNAFSTLERSKIVWPYATHAEVIAHQGENSTDAWGIHWFLHTYKKSIHPSPIIVTIPPARKGRVVLDIASGDGIEEINNRAVQRGRTILSDLNPVCVKIMRETMNWVQRDDLQIVQLNATALPFEDNSIDQISINRIWEYLSHDETLSLFKEAWRVLPLCTARLLISSIPSPEAISKTTLPFLAGGIVTMMGLGCMLFL